MGEVNGLNGFNGLDEILRQKCFEDFLRMTSVAACGVTLIRKTFGLFPVAAVPVPFRGVYNFSREVSAHGSPLATGIIRSGQFISSVDGERPGK